MSEIDSGIICHKLSINTDAKLANQKPKRMNEKWSRAISDEVVTDYYRSASSERHSTLAGSPIPFS